MSHFKTLSHNISMMNNMNQQAKVIFYDGQRVKREDLEYLQNNLLDNQTRILVALGKKGINWGFRVTAIDNNTVNIGEGLAYDKYFRPIIFTTPQDLSISLNDSSIFIVAKYVAQVTQEINGQPVQISHSQQLSIFNESDAQTAEGIIVAQIRPREGGFDIIQKGEWFIPPLNATHSGHFYEDAEGRWRYDGDPVVSAIAPDFDSGWVELDANSDLNIPHGLGSNNLLVQLQNKIVDGVISNKGNGQDFYYELHDTHVVRLFNSTDNQLALNVKLWRLDADINPMLMPVADAGLDLAAEYGESFELDGSDSMAFEGRSVVRYRWTLNE